MARRVINEDTVAKAVGLRKSGLTYSAIGDALGIDPRTAKNACDRANAGSRQDHWEQVERQVDAQYLLEHHQLLMYAAAGVLKAVSLHPRDAAGSLVPGVWLAHQVGEALAQADALLSRRGIAFHPRLDGDVLVPHEVSLGLLGSLKEHEPDLAETLDGRDGWVRRWNQFQMARGKLLEVARNLLSKMGYGEEAIWEAAESLVKDAALRAAEVEGGVVAARPEDSGAVRPEDYQRVLTQVTHPGRLTPLGEAATLGAEASSKVAAAVTRVQLRGKPAGHCTLCPSTALPQAPRNPSRNRARDIGPTKE